MLLKLIREKNKREKEAPSPPPYGQILIKDFVIRFEYLLIVYHVSRKSLSQESQKASSNIFFHRCDNGVLLFFIRKGLGTFIRDKLISSLNLITLWIASIISLSLLALKGNQTYASANNEDYLLLLLENTLLALPSFFYILCYVPGS